MQKKSILFSGGASLPAMGQGTWYMGEDAGKRKEEVAALRAGIELGLTLIDTAEMYADGGAEKVVGEALTGLRDNVFLVSKVYPWNAGGKKAIAACENSLHRLNTEYLDLYLLHGQAVSHLKKLWMQWKRLSRKGKSVVGVFLISIMLICRRCGRPQGVSNAPLTRCFIISVHAGSNMISCHGASSNICQ